MPHLMIICDQKAKAARLSILNQSKLTNIRFHIYDTLMNKKNQQLSISVKELLQLIDVEATKRSYIKIKYPNIHNLIDIKVRNNFTKGILLKLMIKYCYRYN